MNQEELKLLLESYLRRITNANDCYTLYHHLVQSHKNHLDVMNIAPAFFQLTEYS